jgi:hypothetical protein
MIVVSTAHDPTSNILDRYAQTLVRRVNAKVPHYLGPPNGSIASAIRTILTQRRGEPLFFFGHGTDTPPSLIAQDLLPFIDLSSCHLLENRLVCATCCHALNGIGSEAKRHRATILGYRGEFYVPLTEISAASMEDCALTGASTILGGGDTTVATQKAASAFRNLAQDLYAHLDTTDQILGVFMDLNADAAGFEGQNRTL